MEAITPISARIDAQLAAADRQRPFLVLDGVVTDQTAMADRIGRAFAVFAEKGLKPGDRLAILNRSVLDVATLILRTRVGSDRPFRELVAAQLAGIKGALAHEAYPFHMVVRETGVQPRFGLNWFARQPNARIAGVEVLRREFIYTQTNYDLDLRFVAEGDEVIVYAFYDSGRYSAERIDAILADLALALDRIAEDPERQVSTIFDPPAPLVVPEPTRLTEGRLHDVVLVHVQETPERIALAGPEGTLTYGQLGDASAALDRRLIAKGMGPGSRSPS